MALVETLDRYRRIRTLGTGGMATVILAEDTLLGREVALKRLSAAADVRSISRLRREALLGASISHPNVVSIYDVITPEDGDGDVVIVMEYIEGETLRDRLEREGRLSPEAALTILSGAAAGLDAIHARGIVHRDVKPANILLARNDAVKVADLGIAAALDRTRITTAGSVMGSFSYMAPEQLEDAPATSAIDVYALAAVAYEALSGARAHSESTPIAVAHAIATQPPPDLRSVWPEAPTAAAAVLRGAMTREPDRRPKSPSLFVNELRTALAEEPTGRTAVQRPGRGVAPAAAAAALGAAAGAAADGAGAEAAPAPARPAPAAAATRRPAGPREPARAPAAPAAGSPRSNRWLAPLLLLLLLAIAAVAIALATSGSGGTSSHSNSTATPPPTSTGTATARSHTTTAPAAPSGSSTGSSTSPSSTTTGSASSSASSSATTPSTQSTPATSTAPSGSTSPPPATGGSASPVGAVESFYGLAASHQYAAAWRLADSNFQSQLGGYNSFAAQQSGDKRIIFDQANVTSQSANAATVAVRTTSVRTDGTQHCAGTVQLARPSASGTWMLDRIGINCA